MDSLRPLLFRRFQPAGKYVCPHAQFDAPLDSHSPGCYDAYAALSECVDSAESCRECRILLRLIEDFKPGWIQADKEGEAMIRVSYERNHLRDYGNPPMVELYLDLLEQGTLWEKWHKRKVVGAFQYFIESKSSSLMDDFFWRVDYSRSSELPQCLDIVEDSSSSAAFDRATTWLTHCIENDEVCKPSSSEFVPRRLISIDLGSTDDPILFEPKEPVQYACLSYCWGPNAQDVLKTTLANLASHYEAIPYKHLPRTVQDAITVCKGMKIEFLWVDALCIVQDDKLEWAHECKQMRDIYRHSHLTIAVLEATSCKDGFLEKQNYGSLDWQRKADISTDDLEQSGHIFIRKFELHREELKQPTSLDKRGWCLQESILPNRRLCFDGNEMIWECHCRRTCECGHTRWGRCRNEYERGLGALRLWNIRVEPSKIIPERLISALGNYSTHRNIREVWKVLVAQYSSRSLTHATDRLKAISGLAHSMTVALHEDPKDVYLAGLRKPQFLMDLTWRVASHEKDNDVQIQQNDPPLYVAPSWSWASIGKAVLYDNKCHEDDWACHEPYLDSTIDDISCDYALPDDPTGHVKSGHATLTGPLVSVKLASLSDTLARTEKRKYDWSNADTKPKTFARSASLHPVEIHLDRPCLPVLNAGDPQAACWQQGQCNTGCCKKEDITGGSHDPKFCLRLFSCDVTENKNTTYRNHEIWFLLLQKLPGDSDTYKRIGVGRGRRERGDAVLFDDASVTTVTIV